ncbi:MAG: hypothetical protein AAGG07_04135 [Planctomycetota bacterium]
MDPMLAVHAFATLYMMGLIWFVQVVHYPLFARVGREQAAAYEIAHTKRTTLAVGPPMLAEAITAGAIALAPPDGIEPIWAYVGAALVLVLWLSTALVQVPCHHTLSRGFDQRAWTRLVRTNWIRTVIWTARGVLALWFLISGTAPAQ